MLNSVGPPASREYLTIAKTGSFFPPPEVATVVVDDDDDDDDGVVDDDGNQIKIVYSLSPWLLEEIRYTVEHRR